MVKITGMGANAKFGLMVLATLSIMVLLVVSGERRDLKAGAASKVDLKQIQAQVSAGNLTLHLAEFGKKLGSTEDAE